jgi:phosphoglycolate phosphatase-like HAD superfamily hydrolase
MTVRFEAIVFDFDGVLVDSVDVKTRAFAALYAEYGADFERQVVAHHLAHAGISRFVKFRHYHEDLLGLRYDEATGKQLSARFSRLVVDAIIAAPYVIGAREFLDAWHDRLPLFVASGTPDEELREIVQRRGMQRYFKSVHGSPATKTEILRGVIARHQLASAHVLMVGDATADLDGARAAGTAFLGRTEAGGSPFPPDVPTIPDLTALAARL